MKLKSIDGKVPYIMVAGKDLVSGEMPLDVAERICSQGVKTTSKRFPGYPICVNDKLYFAGIENSRSRKTKK